LGSAVDVRVVASDVFIGASYSAALVSF
jgi:hypothetical protein